MAKVRIAIESNDRLGERPRVLRLHENSIANEFRDGGGACGHNRLAGSHSLQKYDAETLLNTGQAEDVRTVVLLGQCSKGGFAEPLNHGFEI